MHHFTRRFYNKFILSTLFVAVLFSVPIISFAQTCTQWQSPLTGQIVTETQFTTDATQVCGEVGRTDVAACVQEFRDTSCKSYEGTADNTTKTGDSSIAGVMSATVPVIGVTFKTVLYLVNFIISILLWLAGQIAALILEFNMSILDFDPPFVATGWTIFRDIANLGFVLGIIIIAVATILRYKDYVAKQILWKLVVAALVVNFSLVIAGAFIQVSNTVSAYLLAATTGAEAGNIGESAIAKIGDSFGYMKLVESVSNWGVLQTLGDFIGVGSGASVGVLAALFILVIFGVVFLFTLIAFAGMLFLRYFWLSFLLMVSPIVWLLWVFPKTKTHFSEWWNKFIKWTVYTPILLVFVYIALAVMQNYSKYQETINAKMGFSFNLSGDKGNLDFGALMTALFACALLIGGMKMADKMGVVGTKMVIGGWDKAVNKTKTWAKARAKWAGARVGEKTVGQKSFLGRNIQKGLVGIGGYKPKSKWGKVLFGATGAPVIRYAAGEAAQGFAIGQAKMEKGSQKLSGDYKKRLEQLSPDQLMQLLPTFNTNEQTAALTILASKNKMNELDVVGNEQHRKVALNVMNNMGKVGMGKEKGELEKKIGANEDMLTAWDKDKENGSFKRFKKEKDGSLKIDKETGKPEEEVVTFNNAAEKFFKDFGKEDYKNFAKNYGKIFEKPEDVQKQAAFLKPYILNITTTDLGTGMGSFSSALKNEEQRKGFYTELVRGIANRLPDSYRIKLNPILDTIQPDGITKPRKLEQKDFDNVIEILKNSGDPTAKKLANKIDKSISAQLTGIEDEEKEEKKGKSEEPPADKGGTKK